MTLTTEIIEGVGYTEMRVTCDGKNIAALTVGERWIDFDNELSNESYNLFWLEPNGSISNDKPTLND